MSLEELDALLVRRLQILVSIGGASGSGASFERLTRWRDATVEELAGLHFGSLAKTLQSCSPGGYSSRGPYAYSARLQSVLTDMRADVKIDPHGMLGSRDRPSAPSLSIEGAFFAGQQYDAFKLVDGLISGATRLLEIVDPYFDKAGVDLLAAKQPGVGVRILIGPKAKPIAAAIAAFNKQAHSQKAAGMEIRATNDFHDRFLVVDGIDYYHFGASFNHLGTRGFMFSRVEEPSVVQVVRSAIDSAWAGGKAPA